jgi:hypothetical protein
MQKAIEHAKMRLAKKLSPFKWHRYQNQRYNNP